MKRITKILLCVLCAVAAVLCVAAACFMLLKKQSGTTANSAASGASVSIYGKVSDFDYASFDYSEGLDDNGHRHPRTGLCDAAGGCIRVAAFQGGYRAH